MKPQEALHEISTMVFRNTDNFEMRISKDCYKNIVNALEKQMPKRPLKKRIANDGYAWEWVCPSCHIVKVTTEKQFCDDCGQRIDWSDHSIREGGEG